jgi:serine/threonine-protein kinase
VSELRLEPGVTLSGHLLSEEIGVGGFSRVFRAEPVVGGPAVAIKVAIRPELAAALRAEGSVLRRLEGPRFVKVLSEHWDQDPPCVVLELCPGGDLRALLDRSERKRLPPERVLAIATGVLEGMAFAHDEGLVHGDLKPENVLLDASGEPKIADLGLSRARREELLATRNALDASVATEASKIRGTFDYLAPEVRAGAGISTASDVYALGVLIYELLVGARPLGLFRLPGEILRREGIAVPAALDRVVARALAHDVLDRFPDASVMLAHLEAGDAGLVTRPATKLPEAAGPNPLLLGLRRESFLDDVVTIAWLAFFYGVIPLVLLAVFGKLLEAGALLAVIATLSACVLLPMYVLDRLRTAWLMKTVARFTEERS